jgi:hypothetical protein
MICILSLPVVYSTRNGFSRPQLDAYQPLLQRAQIPDVSSKEGAVIGAVLGTRKFHRGHH